MLVFVNINEKIKFRIGIIENIFSSFMWISLWAELFKQSEVGRLFNRIYWK